ncbi:methyltransferase domain-containing protein [bacterium]|nr:methyltransferase domain-containing protein [bacterium]
MNTEIEELIIKQTNIVAGSVLNMLHGEYTLLPRFGYHWPIDHDSITLPPSFEATENDSSGLPVPTGQDRYGYATEDTQEYLAWGKYDHDLLIATIEKYLKSDKFNKTILDFGCSTGRVLRHFEFERKSQGWNLYGCDIQARCIEWIRHHFHEYFNVISCSTIPHLQYQDNTFDVIYGFSVFTHIKYQWDAWLMELRRVLKPGGLLIQTIHTETAWDTYYRSRDEEWVKSSHTPRVYETPVMDVDYLYYGDVSHSQIFWKKQIAVKFWGRYFEVLERMDPPERSFQDWMICRKEVS